MLKSVQVRSLLVSAPNTEMAITELATVGKCFISPSGSLLVSMLLQHRSNQRARDHGRCRNQLECVCYLSPCFQCIDATRELLSMENAQVTQEWPFLVSLLLRQRCNHRAHHHGKMLHQFMCVHSRSLP